MNTIDKQTNQETLDSLRRIRNTLYQISSNEVAAMSLDDQITYGRNIQEIGIAIWNLEAAKLKEVNDEFKKNEQALRDSTLDLESSLNNIKNSVELIRVIANVLKIITAVVVLLG